MMEWLRILRKCQEDLLPDALPDYREYSNQELDYWYHVPQWMWDVREYKGSEYVGEVLDVGCGHGTLSYYASKLFPMAEIEAMDITQYISDRNIKKIDCRYVAGIDIELEDLPDYDYDMIIFTEVLEHLYFNPVPTLRKLREMLTGRGRIYLSTPDEAEWGPVHKYYSHIGEMSQPFEVPKPRFDWIHEHIYQYNLGECLLLFSMSGLEVERFGYTLKRFGGRHLNFVLKAGR